MSYMQTVHLTKPHLNTVVHGRYQHLEPRRTERNINSINVFQVHGRVGKEVAEDTLQCVPKVLLGACRSSQNGKGGTGGNIQVRDYYKK